VSHTFEQMRAVPAVLAFVAQASGAEANHGHRSSADWLPRTATPALSESLVAEDSLPTDFDWRNVGGKNYVTSDWNQHIPQYCGACWIHGTLAAYNDRIKIRRNAAFPDVRLARQAILNCVPGEDGIPPGCNGGDASMIHEHLSKQRMPDETCMPYRAANMACEPTNVCRNCATNGTCWPVKNYIGYGVSSHGKVSGEKAMMKEIYARGPIVCSFATDDFWMYNYSNNVVQHHGVYMTSQKKTPDQVDHDMEVAGWGETESGEKYWVIRNSWGTYWGQAGWAKLQRGTNALLSEADCAWAEPTWDELDGTLDSKILGSYVQGIASEKKFEETPWTPPAAFAASAPTGRDEADMTLAAVVAGAFFSGASVALVAVLVGSRSRVRTPSLLLG